MQKNKSYYSTFKSWKWAYCIVCSSTIVLVLHIRQTRQNSFWDVMTTEEQAIGATCWENDTKAKILRHISIFLDVHNSNFQWYLLYCYFQRKTLLFLHLCYLYLRKKNPWDFDITQWPVWTSSNWASSWKMEGS